MGGAQAFPQHPCGVCALGALALHARKRRALECELLISAPTSARDVGQERPQHGSCDVQAGLGPRGARGGHGPGCRPPPAPARPVRMWRELAFK